jgi:hypothetical protein
VHGGGAEVSRPAGGKPLVALGVLDHDRALLDQGRAGGRELVERYARPLPAKLAQPLVLWLVGDE